MRNLSLVLLVLIAGCQSAREYSSPETAVQQPVSQSAAKYSQTITEEELKDLLYTYASDAFMGRETGTPGERMAVEFLEAKYRELGVAGALGDDQYLQAVPLAYNAVPEGFATLDQGTFENGDGILTFSDAKGTDLEVVYLGYGIDSPVYSDYKNFDVKGKVVLARYGEPQNSDGTFLISGTENPSAWGNPREALNKRLEVAVAKGAAGLLYYDPSNFTQYGAMFKRMKQSGGSRLVLKNLEANPFSIVLDQKPAEALLPGIDTNFTPAYTGRKASFAINTESEPVASFNVAAVIRGKSKPEEYVVVSAHLDHIGAQGDDINNGADDDGSGTVALLEIAEAFRQAQLDGQGPQRTIVFLHVTGEEKGLLGSRYYTDVEPIYPLDQTITNLNIDMIGRIDPKRNGDRNYVYLIGSDKLSTELHQLSEQVNRECCGITLDYTYNREDDPNRFYYRSDHYNFAKNNIPVIFYFNGTHEDYHRPSDTPDKINYDLLTNRTKLVFHTAWEIANQEEAIEVDADKRK